MLVDQTQSDLLRPLHRSTNSCASLLVTLPPLIFSRRPGRRDEGEDDGRTVWLQVEGWVLFCV